MTTPRTAALLAALCLVLVGASALALSPRTPTSAARDRPPFLFGANTGPASFEGRVTERLPAGGYLYLQVERDDGDPVWVASLAKPIAVGAHVHVRAFATRSPFPSARLGRTFESVTFAVVTSTDTPKNQEL